MKSFSIIILLLANGAVASESQVTPGELSPQQESAISLPASLFKRFDDRDTVGVLFTIYKSATLFPVEKRNADVTVAGKQTAVGSQVVAAIIVNSSNEVIDLEEPIVIVFRPQIAPDMVSF